MYKTNQQLLQRAFRQSPKKHVLMITNHGIHQWDIIPGLPDTGGQNVFVNQFTDTLAEHDYKVTIVNRGGFAHPVTGEMRTGLSYKDEDRRIYYVEDNVNSFVRKEDMNDKIPALADNLSKLISNEGMAIDLIVSHYWDGAKIGVLVNQNLGKKVQHVWVPHSFGAMKKRNESPERWEMLRVDERIAHEHILVKEIDFVGYTSLAVKDSLEQDYNGHNGIFLPPCVMTDRFNKRNIEGDHEIWNFLSTQSGLAVEKVKKCQIVTEISRTDNTKRKDVLIEAFAKLHKKHPDTFLIVAIDDNEKELAASLKKLIRKRGIEKNVAAIGNEWDRMPDIYGVTNVYCSPSIMEGFGMSAQEAAATGVPVIGSALIPFVREYLAGEDAEVVKAEGENFTPNIKKGKGAFLVEPNCINSFAMAMETLITNHSLQKEMGKEAFDITIPYFTWNAMLKKFMTVLESSTKLVAKPV